MTSSAALIWPEVENMAAAKTGTKTRPRNLVVRMAVDELEMMHGIVALERETAATLIRRWIRQQAEVRGIAIKKSA
jgi:hypothetical protein